MKIHKKIIVLIILAILFSILMIQVISKKINKTVYKYSNIEAKRFGVYVINNSIDKEFIKKTSDNIFTITKNTNEEIQMIDFKSKETNEMLENITKKIQKNLIDLENGKLNMEVSNTFHGLRYKDIKNGVVCELPVGLLFSNVLFSNIGPVIPIRFNFIGDVLVNLDTHVHTYGINTVYFEMNIHVELENLISMPTQTRIVQIKTNIPIAVKILQGKIPLYYQSEVERQSEIFSLPLNKKM